MADKKWEGGERKTERSQENAEELERRGADESGRDPTARRGEIEEGGSVSDDDVGAEGIQRKAIGGYGADTGESVKGGAQKPLSDNSPRARGEPEGEQPRHSSGPSREGSGNMPDHGRNT